MRTLSARSVGAPARALLSLVSLSLALVPTTPALVAGASPLPSTIVPAPYGPAANGAIAYGKDGDIWLVDADGSHPRALIADPAEDTYPWFSPDGTRFAFERAVNGQPHQVMVADADGSDVSAIVDVPGDWWWSDWSPDSRSMLVVWAVEGRMVISILSTDGSQAATTLDLGEIQPLFAGWRPTDGEIVFTGHPEAGSPTVQLYAIAADGTGLREIGEPAADEGALQDIAFSPDGSRIAYWNWEPQVGGASNLYARDLVTGLTQALSLDPAYPGVGTGPRFVTNETLLFETGPHGGTGDVNSQLAIAPLDASVAATPLGTPYTYKDRKQYDLSPDGSTVLLDLAGETWLVDTSTGVATLNVEHLSAPSWQRR